MVEKLILVVEDDAAVRTALAEALEAAGARAVVAEDGLDGLRQLRAGVRPSVILLDVGAPQLGGDALLRALRTDARFEHIPVITMSAGPDPSKEADVVARLREPFDLENLLQIVLSLFEADAA